MSGPIAKRAQGAVPKEDVTAVDATVRAIRDRLVPMLEGRGEVLEAYLFGSIARGTATEHSDVDVAVTVDEGRLDSSDYGYEAELGADLVSALGRNRVDVVVLNRAPPLLYHRVLQDGVRLMSRDLTATTVREGRALSRYCDYVPQLAKIERAASERLRRGDFGRRR